MITFLWMLYLAAMVYLTFINIMNNMCMAMYYSTYSKKDKIIEGVQDVIGALMIAIWYMYYLH